MTERIEMTDRVVETISTHKDNNGIPRQAKQESFIEMEKNQCNKIIALISLSVLLTSMTISIGKFLIEGQETDYLLLTFQFNSLYTPFQTNATSFFFILLVLIAMLISTMVYIITDKDSNFLGIFYKDVFRLYAYSFLVFSGSFMITVTMGKDYYTMIISLITVTIAGVFSFFAYLRIKKKKNFSCAALVNLNFFISIYMSLQVYFFFFLLCDIITRTAQTPFLITDLKANMALSLNVLYSCTAIGIIATFKDVVYALTLLIIEVGYLSTSELLTSREIITSVSLSLFIFISVILTLFKYKKLVFGYEDSEELIRTLEKHQASNNYDV